jgi:hypothetical protein
MLVFYNYRADIYGKQMQNLVQYMVELQPNLNHQLYSVLK